MAWSGLPALFPHAAGEDSMAAGAGQTPSN